MESKKIGIVGSGLIGRSWAMLFTSAGHQVALYDVSMDQVNSALTDILDQLQTLENKGMLRGTDSATVQHSRITGASSLQQCVEGAYFVQECVPELLDLKKEIFLSLDAAVGPDTILSSSSSCIVPSKFTEGLQHRSNCLVSHPVNPPYFVPLVEIVPAPWTCEDVVKKTRAIMLELGQAPVCLKKEWPGFGLNRIQYAILNECCHLVNDDVLSAEDVDTLMSAGLGPRYTWMGPLETAHLNAEGMGNYVERYGESIMAVSGTLKGPAVWTPAVTARIVSQMEQTIPLDTIPARRRWRDERLMAFAELRNTMKKKEKTD